MNGIDLIAKERQRQIEEEGWTAPHDCQHEDGSLAAVAACYANPFQIQVDGSGVRIEEILDCDIPVGWPDSWDAGWWKPSEDRRRDLAKAGALIAAEIDRLNLEHSETN